MQTTRTSIMDALNRDYRNMREATPPEQRPAASLVPARGIEEEDLERAASWVAQNRLGQLRPARVQGRWLFIPAGEVETERMEELVRGLLDGLESRFRREVFLPHNWLLKTAAAALE